jgi:two-component system heavy metal sensor histidine kinase CusS
MSPRPQSIQSRLSLWFAAQTLFGLSVICLAIYLVTAWNFGEKQEDELDQKAVLVEHLLKEAEKGGDLVFLRHKLDDFFSMQDDVSLSIALQLEAFNADVAHELRTPLGNLIGMTQVTLARPRDASELADVMLANLEDLERLRGIVNDMLFLARADRGTSTRSRAVVSLAAQARDVIDFYDAMLDEAGLKAEVAGDAMADVDASLVRRALSNLLGNAIRFAAPASTIRIKMAEGSDEFVLSVVNRGEPIDPAALPRLFERFYRAAQARDGSTRHHGLGLSIVEAIARMHGGRVFASSEGGETRIGFTVRRNG